MKTLTISLYKYFLLVGLRANTWKSLISAKFAGVAFFSLVIVMSVVQTGAASEVESAGVIPVASPDKLVNQYISRTGYVEVGVANTTLGSQRWVSTTRRLSRGFSGGHTGLDVDGEFGDPIYAMTDGIVRDVTTTGPYGNKVVIEHANGVTTLYAHMQVMFVQPGQAVTGGQQIGEMGSTGASTGSHLHFEVFKNGQLVDPATFSYL